MAVSAENALRRATTRELRAKELLGSNVEAGRAMLAGAASDYLLHGSLTTLQDDISGPSLWKGAELLDQAGDTAKAIQVYERLTIQRPRDGKVAEGLLLLGQLYESAGKIDKALAAYERNVRENPLAPATYLSQINEARCHVTLAKQVTDLNGKKAELEQAEKILVGLVEVNRNLLPSTPEFHDGLLAAATLYYDTREILESAVFPLRFPLRRRLLPLVKSFGFPSTSPAVPSSATTSPTSAPSVATAAAMVRGRWSDAILRLDEFLERHHPNDPQTGRVMFLLAGLSQECGWRLRRRRRIQWWRRGRSWNGRGWSG